PKVGVRNVLALMDIREPIERWLHEPFGYETEDDLLRAMVRVFARSLDRALGQGLRRSYRDERESLASIRGRVDMGAMARRSATSTLVRCAFDEYTVDVPLNRLLLAAVLRARVVPGVPARVRSSLHRHLTGSFEGVQPIADFSWFDRWKPT